METHAGATMSEEIPDPFTPTSVRLKTDAATAPPDAGGIEPVEEVPPIHLVEGDRAADIALATGGSVQDGLPTARLERHVRGHTGTGLQLVDERIVDPELERLKTIEGQVAFAQERLGHIFDLSRAPCGEEPAAEILLGILERCEGNVARELRVVGHVLRGEYERAPILLRHAVTSLAAAHERWSLMQAAEEELNGSAGAPATDFVDAGETLDERVLREAIEQYGSDAAELNDVSLEPDDSQIPLTHEGSPPPEPLLTKAERDAIDAVMRESAEESVAHAAAASPIADSVEIVRGRNRRSQPATTEPLGKLGARRTAPVGKRPAEHPVKRTKATERDRAASVHALWWTACLMLVLVAVIVVYLMRQDGQIRIASQERDAKQDETLAEHTASIRSHARTLASLVPVLAEKDAEIVDLTTERDSYAQLAVDSQEAIDALDRRVGGQVGSLARDLADTRAELRRKVDEQARQIEALGAQLAGEQQAESTTPAP